MKSPLLQLNNKSDYIHLVPEGEDFYIPEKELPKIEVSLHRLWSLQEYGNEDSDDYIDAIKNLVWLNRKNDTAFLTSAIPGVLNLEPPDDKEVIELIKGFIKDNREGQLKPEYFGGWQVISKDGYNAQGKQKLFEERINTQNISDSIQTMMLGSEKITQNLVAERTNLSIRTIKSRWSNFKAIVKEFNDSLKEK